MKLRDFFKMMLFGFPRKKCERFLISVDSNGCLVKDDIPDGISEENITNKGNFRKYLIKLYTKREFINSDVMFGYDNGDFITIKL